MNRILGVATLLWAISSSLFAGDVKFSEAIRMGKTNQTNTVRVSIRDLIPTNRYEGRFVEHLEDRLPKVVERQVHPFNSAWRLLVVHDRIEFDERLGKIGYSVFKRSTEQAVRETIKDLPFAYFLINQETFFARLFKNSVGNTAEQDLLAGETLYSKNEEGVWVEVTGEEARNTNQISLWKRFTGHIEPRYGVRVDYAYAAFTVTRHKRALFFVDLRYRYNDLISGDLEGTAFETLVSAPLGRNYFIGAGIVQRIDSDWTRRFNIKLTHRLPIDDGRLFLGVSWRQSQSDPDRYRITSGLEFQW